MTLLFRISVIGVIHAARSHVFAFLLSIQAMSVGGGITLPLAEFDERHSNVQTAAHMVVHVDALLKRDTAVGDQYRILLIEEAILRRRMALRWEIVTRVVAATKRMDSWRLVWREEAPHDLTALLERDDVGLHDEASVSSATSDT